MRLHYESSTVEASENNHFVADHQAPMAPPFAWFLVAVSKHHVLPLELAVLEHLYAFFI